jgi:ADP-dependent NAD(P)H-hydrate dehydratase / NAD(P)H-hydrate epimerase
LRPELLGSNAGNVVVLCGKGNNGGDGFVVARKLREEGRQPRVFVFANPAELRGDAAANFARLRSVSIEPEIIGTISEWESARASLLDAEIIVDALLGTGLKGKVEGLLSSVIDAVNHRKRSRTFVVSVDIPSGLSGDKGDFGGPVIRADRTITFTAPKIGMFIGEAADRVGALSVGEIGSPRALIEEVSKGSVRWIEPWEFRDFPYSRQANSNKGNYGHILVVAGSVGKAGAAALTGLAALRIGAGLVTVATPSPVFPIVSGFAPEIMTEPLSATRSGSISHQTFTSGRFNDLLRGKSVLALGPGLSTDEETQLFVRSTLASKLQIPVILDADGINAYAASSDVLGNSGQTMTITPHPGEMARLIGCTVKEVQERRLEVARMASAILHAFVVLKGHQTVIARPDGSTWINSTGNPWMSTGGTGDVLTGILAGLTGQFGASSWPSTLALGVYLHGLAGDMAAAASGGAPIVASDVSRYIPQAIAQLRTQSRMR